MPRVILILNSLLVRQYNKFNTQGYGAISLLRDFTREFTYLKIKVDN